MVKKESNDPRLPLLFRKVQERMRGGAFAAIGFHHDGGEVIVVVCVLREFLLCPRWVQCCRVFGWCLGGTGCSVMCVWSPG